MFNLRSLTSAAALSFGALVLCAPYARAEARCAPFTATGTGSYYLPGQNPLVPAGGWVADLYFTIQGVTLHAKAIYDASEDIWKKPPAPGVNTSIATERGRLTFDDGSKLEMAGHFAAPLEKFAEGIFRLNEAGTIENGTGAFQNVSGYFTTHGIFGPAVARPDSAAVLGAILESRGNICLDPSAPTGGKQ